MSLFRLRLHDYDSSRVLQHGKVFLDEVDRYLGVYTAEKAENTRVAAAEFVRGVVDPHFHGCITTAEASALVQKVHDYKNTQLNLRAKKQAEDRPWEGIAGTLVPVHRTDEEKGPHWVTVEDYGRVPRGVNHMLPGMEHWGTIHAQWWLDREPIVDVSKTGKGGVVKHRLTTDTNGDTVATRL